VSASTFPFCLLAADGTLVKSPVVHHFFILFIYREVLILLVPNRWCESSPTIQTHSREPLSRRDE
jgi:hypothetical protein